MPPKADGTTRGRGARRARGSSSRGRGGRGAAQAAAAQEPPQNTASSPAKEPNAAEEDSLFVPKDDSAPNASAAATVSTADVSMTDADITTTTEPTHTNAAPDTSAGASHPDDVRISSVLGSQTPTGSPAPSIGATRGGKKAGARMPTFKGRRSKEEREALEAEAERKRRERLHELNNEASRGRGDRGRGRGRGDRGGRGGRGGYMGQRGFEASLRQDMGGVFASGTVNENRSRMIHRGKTFGASHQGRVKRERTIIRPDGDNEGVKSEDVDEEGYISSDPEIEILGPRQDVDNIETINLVSDDEDGGVEMAGGLSRSRRSRTRLNTPGLAPIRIRRREHENAPRKITAEAPGDPEIKTEPDTSSPRKGKGKAKDVEVTGAQGRWKGAWGYEDEEGLVTIKDEPSDEPTVVPSDVPEEPVKDAPSSPELSKKTKPRIKQRRKPRFRDVRAALVSEEDKQEQERHEQSMKVLADELGEIVLPAAATPDVDAGGDTAMADTEAPKQEQPVDKKKDRAYLFQLPPVLPSLMVDETVKKEPPSPEATSRSNPVDLATPETHSNTPVKPEDDAAGIDTVSPELPAQLASGAVGKLRVHQSGRTTLDWGGTSLELCMGMDASFLQDIIVTKVIPEEQRVGRDGGEAMSVGQVCGKFVVTPDWDEIVG
ncbi:Translin-1 [Diplodia intermedia]|uniref:Translin-1 n=1 Tax=Diplodia intermedia TaxID=856260 RepID=A0ABR3TWE8_9PEZI